MAYKSNIYVMRPWRQSDSRCQKRQIDAVFIPYGKIIARLSELKIAYYLLLTIIFLAHGIEYATSFINKWKFVVTLMK